MTNQTAPDGYYAVRYLDKVGFYRLRTSKGGRWDGFQWVDRFHSDDRSKVSKAEQLAVVAAIATDPVRAGRAFAAEFIRCFNCGRALTDALSRKRGIGPDCYEKVGVSLDREIDVDVADAPRVEAVEAEETPEIAKEREVERGVLTVEGKKATLRAGYDYERVNRCRAIPGRKWNAAEKVDTFPVNAATVPLLVALAKDFDLRVEGDGLPDLEALEAKQAENVEASKATDSTLTVEDLGGDLLPFQRAGVAYAVANDSVLIGDEMGLGKTVQALAALAARDAFPALVIVPAVVKINWERETAKWLPKRSVATISGRANGNSVVPETDVVVINYDLVASWKDLLLARGFAALVADESHYVKNGKAQRTKAVRAIARKVDLRLLLTGTPVLNRPVELISQLDVLGRLEDFGGFWGFANRYCAAHRETFGWNLNGAAHLDELHERLRSLCYIRRTKDQVLAELPAKRRSVVPVEMANVKRYREVEADLAEWLRSKVERDADFAEAIADLDPEDAAAALEREVERRDRRAEQAETLVRIEALKQTAVEEKMESVKSWLADFVESGKKIVVFAHHREIVDALAAALGAPKITGSTSVADRQAAVDRFQNDDSVRAIVCNIAAGGVGITLTAASDVAFVELPWRPGDLDQAEDRCHRIGQTDSVTAWYLLAADTIEEDIAALIDEKRAVVEAATDGREVPSTSIMAGLLGALAGKE